MYFLNIKYIWIFYFYFYYTYTSNIRFSKGKNVDIMVEVFEKTKIMGNDKYTKIKYDYVLLWLLKFI